jgi:endonuclease YncB( thermonuclease family)
MRWFLTLASLLIVPPAAADTLSGVVSVIHDGDTLTLVDKDKKRYRIRLAEIDAPERKQSYGTNSRNSLAAICFQKPALVETTEADSYGRRIGKVKCDGVDANTEQVRRGMAWVNARSTLPNSPLPEMEANARLRKLGLWAGEKPEPPWKWRERQAAAAKK